MNDNPFLEAILGDHAHCVRPARRPHALALAERRGGFMAGAVARWIAEHYGLDWYDALECLLSLPSFDGEPDTWDVELQSRQAVATAGAQVAAILQVAGEASPSPFMVTLQ